MSNKLTKAQAGQLGGLASARTNDNSLKGTRGGYATLDKYGRDHFIRLAHRRNGKDIKLATEVKE